MKKNNWQYYTYKAVNESEKELFWQKLSEPYQQPDTIFRFAQEYYAVFQAAAHAQNSLVKFGNAMNKMKTMELK